MIRSVIAIWACNHWTGAFGYRDKLPWSNYEMDLKMLDDVLSQADYIVASSKLKKNLPESFLLKHKDIIECNSNETLDRVLNRLSGTIVVLGGRTVFNYGIQNKLFDYIIQNRLFFPRDKVIEYDTVAPHIDSTKYELSDIKTCKNNKEGMYITY